MEITRHITINAPAHEVWDVLADFGNVYKANKGITTSKLTSTQTEGVGTTRACDLTMMNATLLERITGWEEGRRLDIDIYDWKNLPGMKTMGASFILEDHGDTTSLTAIMRYDLKWGTVGKAMDATMMRAMNVKGWEEFVAGIKHHVETGEIVDKSTRLDRTLVKQ